MDHLSQQPLLHPAFSPVVKVSLVASTSRAPPRNETEAHMKMHRVPDLPASLRRPSPAPPPALILPPRVGLRRALSTTVRVLSLSLTTLTRGHHRELHPRAIHTAIDRIAGVKQHLHALSVRAASPVAIRAHLVRIHQRRRSCVTTPRARASRAMAAAYRIYHLSTVHLSRASVSPRRRHLSG